MWVLVAVAVGGELMGVAGMFLMIPIASVIHTLLREVTNKRLDGKEIPQDKLQAQPPELVSNIKQKLSNKNKAKKTKEEVQEESN
jgi:predicted PurR-regulated permease PerM